MTDNLSDPELLAGFLDESQEALASLDALFIALEAHPGDLPTVEAIFRPVHSFKGNSAFFGFMQAKRLAHEMETLLDHVRKGRMQASRAAIDVLLAGLDGLKALVERLRAGQPEVVDAPTFDALVERVVAVSGSGAVQPRPAEDLALVERALAAADPAAKAAFMRLRAVLERSLGLAPAERTPAAPPAPDGGPHPLERLKELLAQPFEGQLAEDKALAVDRELHRLRDSAGDDAARSLAEDLLSAHKTFLGTLGFDPMLREYIVERLPQAAKLAFHGSQPLPQAGAAEALERRPSTHAEGTDRQVRTDRQERTDRIDG